MARSTSYYIICRLMNYHIRSTNYLNLSSVCRPTLSTSTLCTHSIPRNKNKTHVNFRAESRRPQPFNKVLKPTFSKPTIETDWKEKCSTSCDNAADRFGDYGGGNLMNDEEDFEDDGDIRENAYLETPPSASCKLRTKQYADMIKKFLNEKKVAEAIDVLETRMLKDDRVKPENYIYNLLISACGRLGYTKKAFQLYNQMKKRALKVKDATYTSLFNSCANSPSPQDGLKRATYLRNLLIEKGYQPNLLNYHAMVKAFGRCGDLTTAFGLVDEMVDQKLALTDETFNFLLQACISDKESGFRHALLVWRKLIEKKVKPRVYTYNLLLRCVRDCGLGESDVANQVLHQLVADGQKHHLPQICEPSREDSNILSSSNRNKNSLLLTVSSQCIADTETSPNFLAQQPQLGNIVALTEITKPEDRLILLGGQSGFFHQMGCDNVYPDIKTFTQLLHVIPSTCSAEEVLLAQMQQSDVRPDTDFYNMLIKKRSLRFDYSGAREVLHMIQLAMLHPDIITFGVLSLGCTTLIEAQALLTDIGNAGFRVNAEILGAMLRQACVKWNFRYVLFIMETALHEEVQPNAQFMNHLGKLHKNALYIAQDKEENLSGVSVLIDKENFKVGFHVFCMRYKTWLKEVKQEEVAHPWHQFKKTIST